MEKKWWHKSCVYQIYPRSFYDSNNDGIGDIKGIISKLDYLSFLGVDVIWLGPFYKSPMVDNGYDISDYQDVAEEFGTIEDVKELISEANKRGLKIIIDLVVNHTSDQHEWFQKSIKDKDNYYRDYYIWRDKTNNLKSTFSGSAWEYEETTNQYYLHLFSKEQPDLNWSNENLRNDIYSMMNWWIDLGVSGFRLDVIDLIGKDIDNLITSNGPNLHTYIQEMNRNTFGKHDLLTVGETWGADCTEVLKYTNPSRNELSMAFQFEHITAFWGDDFGKWNPKPFNLKELKEIFAKWQESFSTKGWNSLFWNNHDLPRAVSKYGSEKYRVESAKMLATVLHFMKGTPYIYQGEEIGMTNIKFDSINEYKDVETLNAYQELLDNDFEENKIMSSIYENGRDNARTPMQWDDSLNAGFTNGNPWLKVNPNHKKINVKNSIKNDNSILHHYRMLIELRRNSEYSDLIIYGDYELLLKDDENIFAYTRSLGNQSVLVLNNFSEKNINLNISNHIGKFKKVLLSNYSELDIQEGFIVLKPYESIVFDL